MKKRILIILLIVIVILIIIILINYFSWFKPMLDGLKLIEIQHKYGL